MTTAERIQRVLRWVAIGGVFLLPLMPFIVASSMFFPFITGKNFFFRIIVEIVFAAWACLAILDARYRPKMSWIFGTLIAFVGVVTLADLLAPSFHMAFWSNFERMEGLITILHLLLYFIAVAGTFRTERVRNWLLRTTVGASVVMGSYGLLQLAGVITINQGGVRLDGTFGNATYLAVYMLVHVFLTLWLLYKDREIVWTRYAYGVAMVLQTIILYYTATRGAILGLLGGILLTALIVLVGGKRRHPRVWRWSAGLLGVVVLVVGGFFVMKATDTIPEGSPLERFASISLTETTVESRFLIWQTAWEGAKERPLLGWGQEGFIYVFTEHFDPEMWKQEPWFDRAHNVFMDWLIAAGFPGLILYLGLFVSALWYLWRSRSFSFPERAILTGLLAGYFFHNIFVFDNIVSYWLFITLIAFIHGRHVYAGSVPVTEMPQGMTSAKHASLGLVGVLLIATVYFVNVPGIVAAQSLLQALVPQEEGITKNLELYQKARAQNTVGRQEAAEQLSNAAHRFAAGSIKLELKQAFAMAAVGALQDEIDQNELNPRPPFFLGSFLVRIGEPEAALPALEHALELGPNRQLTLFELTRVHLQLGDTEQALVAAKKAYNLAPAYNRAAVFYASALYQTGQEEEADEVLAPIPLADQAQSRDFITALATSEKYEKLAEVWEERVRQNPSDTSALLSLAATYVQLGERERAIEEIQEAIEIDPNLKEQGEFYISEIRAGRNP